ncbi:MAG: hypothetical protein EOP49_39390 [Sphingobacteriales bacterium]|nr:MAG: hypothetical protein EOP49_39390 [Sphingobacteriales bacterium]
METNNKYSNTCYQPKQSRAGRVLAGFIIIGTGAVLLAQKLGAGFPDWIFTWPALLIVIGLFIGAKHTFRGFGWMIPILVGIGFLAADLYPGINLKPYIVPVLLILAGISMVFSRGRKWGRRHRFIASQNLDYIEEPPVQTFSPEKKTEFQSSDDILDITAVFGGVKKQMISKNFKGGEINCVCGGTEINLSQADINGRIILELNHVLGGTKLTIPANWRLQSELTTIMGGVEDNRNLHNITPDPDKILVLKGTCFMGGISIMSY